MTVPDGDAARAPRSSRFAGAALGLLLAGFFVRCSDPREVSCENAVRRLADCCPGLDASALQCRLPELLCGGDRVAIEGHQAQCIADASCDALVARGTCASALSLREPYGPWTVLPCP